MNLQLVFRMEEWGGSFFEAVHGVAANRLGTPNLTDRLLIVFSFTRGRRFACGIYKFSVGDLRNKSGLSSAKGLIKRGIRRIESKLDFRVFRRFYAVMMRAM
jgi:hypothetical protein